MPVVSSGILGTIIRPSLVLLDDPQTRESARSADQTKKRLDLPHGDVTGMAGPGEPGSDLLPRARRPMGHTGRTPLPRSAGAPTGESPGMRQLTRPSLCATRHPSGCRALPVVPAGEPD